jgi:hypothetical protein
MYLYGEGVGSCIDIDNIIILKYNGQKKHTAKHCT